MPDEPRTDAHNVIHAQNVTIINNYGAEKKATELEDSTIYNNEIKRQEEIAPGLSNGLRPAVTRFAVAMEKKLVERDDDHPFGWSKDTKKELADRWVAKNADFVDALYSDGDASKLRELGADIANYVMMLVDNAGALGTP